MKERLIFNKIFAQQNVKKISIIIGPRQVGKTTIIKELKQRLGGLFFDVDIFSEYDQVSSYEKFIATLKLNGYQENQADFFYVYLDEFQRYPDLSRVMKSIYDHHNNIKIFATGSSSLEIKNSIQESLAGRKLITHVYPLSFKEFLHFKNRDDLLEKIDRLKEVSTKDFFISLPGLKEALDEFLIFGGYPEVALVDTSEKKQEILRSIFDLYIRKDFAEYVNMEKLRNANQLMRILAINNSQSANYSKYAAAAEINVQTLKNYLSILEETFIISAVRPYFVNKNKEISKLPKIYFLDNGVRNYFSGGFAPIVSRADAGFLFEAFYVGELIKAGLVREEIKYWRTKNGEEVDLIIEKTGQPLLPIEIKFKKEIRTRDMAPLINFIKKNNLPKGYVVAAGQIASIGKVEIIDAFREILN